MPIQKIILFGSRANGKTHQWSDFDIIIVSPKFRGVDSFRRGSIFYDYWNYDYPVDFICYTPEEFNRLKKKISIVREALSRGIVVK